MSRIALLRIILALAIVAVFGRSLLNDWVNWDDKGLICKNPNLNPPTLSGLAKHWNPKDESNIAMYDPLVFTTWWGLVHVAQMDEADYFGSKVNPIIFHLANLCVHILTTLVVLEILRLLGMRDWPAFAGAMIFAVHPIQTEAVVWATAMKDLLSGLLAMLTLWRYTIAAMARPGRMRRANYAVASLTFVAALFCKPSVVVVPLMAMAIDVIIIKRPWKIAAIWVLPWLLLSFVFTWIASSIQAVNRVDTGPLWTRPLIAADALTFYLRKIVAPIDFCMAYGRSPRAVLSDPALGYPIYWAWIVPVAIVALLWRLKKQPLTLAGVLFFLGVLPVLGLKAFVFQYFSTVADRYVYLSMLAIALAIAWIVQNYRRRWMTGFLVVVFVILGIRSFVQVGIWKRTDILVTHALEMNPASARLYHTRGDFLATVGWEEERRAMEGANSSDERKYHAEQMKKVLESSVADFKKCIELDPLYGIAYDSLATTLLKLGRIQEAADVTEKSLELWPRMETADRLQPGDMELTLGLLYQKLNEPDKAIEQFERAIKDNDEKLNPLRVSDLQKMIETLRNKTTNPSSQP